VLLVVDLDDTPWKLSAPNLAAIWSSHLGVGTDNGEGDLAHDLLVLRDCLLVIELVAGPLEDLDLVVGDVGKNLELLAKSDAM
jgi:hypothetical protein